MIAIYTFILTLLITSSPLLQGALDNSKNGEKLYQIDDLEILYQEKNHLEFLAHAKDLRPTERNEKWKKMVEDMAKGYMQNLVFSKDFHLKHFSTVEELNNWPTLRSSEFFQHERNAYLKSYFENCFKDVVRHPLCLNQLESSFRAGPNEGDLTYFYLELINLYDKSKKIDKSPYLKFITQNEIAYYLCKKPLIENEILAIAKSILDQNPDQAEQAKLFNQFLGTDCVQSLKDSLEITIKAQDNQLREVAYALLKHFNKITQEQKDLFYVLFILDGPRVSETFNQAWNTVKELGNHYPRRQIVLTHLKSMDPLPGKIFSSVDNFQKRVVVDFIFAQFPEYLDHYSKQCLLFMQGKIDSPNGNPTPQCRELYQLSQGKIWLESEVQKQLAKYF